MSETPKSGLLAALAAADAPAWSVPGDLSRLSRETFATSELQAAVDHYRTESAHFQREYDDACTALAEEREQFARLRADYRTLWEMTFGGERTQGTDSIDDISRLRARAAALQEEKP